MEKSIKEQIEEIVKVNVKASTRAREEELTEKVFKAATEKAVYLRDNLYGKSGKGEYKDYELKDVPTIQDAIKSAVIEVQEEDGQCFIEARIEGKQVITEVFNYEQIKFKANYGYLSIEDKSLFNSDILYDTYGDADTLLNAEDEEIEEAIKDGVAATYEEGYEEGVKAKIETIVKDINERVKLGYKYIDIFGDEIDEATEITRAIGGNYLNIGDTFQEREENIYYKVFAQIAVIIRLGEFFEIDGIGEIEDIFKKGGVFYPEDNIASFVIAEKGERFARENIAVTIDSDLMLNEYQRNIVLDDIYEELGCNYLSNEDRSEYLNATDKKPLLKRYLKYLNEFLNKKGLSATIEDNGYYIGIKTR